MVRGLSLSDALVKKLATAAAELFNRGQLSQLPYLVNPFLNEMRELGISATGRHHPQLLELLKEGLPTTYANTLHQPLLSQLQPETLMVERFVVLLRGMNAEKRSQQQALEYFEGIIEPGRATYDQELARQLNECPLFLYTLGQLLRKMKRLPEAQAKLESAWNKMQVRKAGARIEPTQCCSTCASGPKCLRNGLPIEVARGLAVVFRSQANAPGLQPTQQDDFKQQAEEWFATARQLLDITPAGQARADYCFSEGYYRFLWACEEPHATLRNDQLRVACDLFRRAEDELASWDAPTSRRAISEHLQWAATGCPTGQVASILNSYRTAENKSKEKNEGESPLTRYLSAGGALLLTLQTNPAIDVNALPQTPAELRDGLASVLARTIYAAGPRNCHAVDARWLIKLTPPVTAPEVQPFFELLTSLGKWSDFQYAEFILSELRLLQRSARLNDPDAVALSAVETWGLNANALLESALRFDRPKPSESGVDRVRSDVSLELDRIRSLTTTGAVKR